MSSNEHPLVIKYKNFSPISKNLAAKAREVFPGGDTRASAHYSPYPLSISKASGCVLTDVDGNQILDFMIMDRVGHELPKELIPDLTNRLVSHFNSINN